MTPPVIAEHDNASRYAAHDPQRARTGKIATAQLHVAAGMSDGIQHLAGMKDSKVIVAIHKEADLFTAMPELSRAL